MNILIFGPPGSGKGTHSKNISEKYNLLHISTGEILRKYKNSDYINKIILSGNLINDEIIFKILKDYINENIKNKYYYKNNIIFDGFPRTYNQALYLNKYIKINIILKLNLDNELIFKRILGRKIHKKSGRIYHDIYNPSIIKDIDDITGEPLEKRLDDNKEIIYNRINEYNNNIKDILKIYNEKIYNNEIKFFNINSNDNIENIKNNIFNILNKNI